MKKLTILGIILVFIIFISFLVGQYKLSFNDIYLILTNQMDNKIKNNVFLKIRLPRVLLVALSGAMLSLSGFVYQSIFKNPLASPDLLGVSTGASLGAIIAILFCNGNTVMISLLSFLLSIITVLMSLVMTKAMKGNKLYNLIISGIITTSLANSLIMYLKYKADKENQLAQIEYFTMGSFNSATIYNLTYIFILGSFIVTLIIILKKKLELLTLPDEEAITLGLNVKVFRILMILLSTLLVSIVVSVVGVVAWIGLIVPHLARMLFKTNFKQTLIISLFLGSILLSISDMFARILTKSELPISILTSGFGAIILFIIMIRRRPL